MQQRLGKIILTVGGIFLAATLAVWWYSGFSLEFMQFFAAAPVDQQAPVPSTSVAITGTLLDCSPKNQTVAVGAPATVSASGGVGSYAWFAPEGSPSTGSGKTISISYTSVGTKKVTVQAAEADGSVDSVACTVTVQ